LGGSVTTGGQGGTGGTPLLPCHLVEVGKPVATFAFVDPTWSFHHTGLAFRQAAADAGNGLRLVQTGEVDGIRTGVWQDDPVYAAEFDVSQWPPAVMHEPSQLFYSSHEPADVVELSPSAMGLAWSCDFDGSQPLGIRYLRFDATTWAAEPDRWLAEKAGPWSRPLRLDPADAIAATYVAADHFSSPYVYQGFAASFAFDGTALGEPQSLWVTDGDIDYTAVPQMHEATTRSSVLVAVTFPSCTNLVSEFCQDRSIVVLYSPAPDASGVLSPLSLTMSLAARDVTKWPMEPQILTDGQGHNWLTWWEADPAATKGIPRSLYAQALTDDGVAASPVELWFSSPDAAAAWFPRRTAGVGPIGVIYPVDVPIQTDGVWTEREIHLLHRQLESQEPLEDIVLTTTYTGWPATTAQMVQPGKARTVFVGCSNYPAGTNDSGFGELHRFQCEEDQSLPGH